MFSVTINVFTATGRGCAVNAVTLLDDNSIFEVNIGLIMQNHYVGLDRINIVDDSQSHTPTVVDLPPNTQYSDNPASTTAGIDDQSPNVAVPCRNRRLFRRVFRLHRCVQSAVSLNFHEGRRSYALHKLIRYSCIYEASMSPALNRSSAIRRFERSDAIEIRDGITFDFYTGLPQMPLIHQ